MATSREQLNRAIELHQAGALDAAAAIYRELLAAEPAHHESLHLLGLIAYQTGNLARAIEHIGHAIALYPTSAAYHNNLGNALQAAGRPRDAADACGQARRLRPDSAEIANNLGAILTELGVFSTAIDMLRDAVLLDPELADARYNLANAMCHVGDHEAALPVYADCLRLRPDFADAHFNLGRGLAMLGRTENAAENYRAALRIDPGHAAAHNNLGVLLRDADGVEEAAACFAESLRLAPSDHAVACNLGAACLAMGRIEEATLCFGQVLAVAPDDGPAAFGRLMATLPVVARDAAEVAASRAAYADELATLIERAENPTFGDALAPACGTFQPFFLAYQGGDDLALQQAYGRLLHRLAPPPAKLARSPAPGERLRVGIVSGHFREHTIWTLFLHGWLAELDRTRFRVFGYHVGTRRDARTDVAAASCERFVEGPRTAAGWRAEILADAPHVLMYPEIGMEPMAVRLASQRLAPLQCAAWGHPVTTGLPSLDVFLSGALMEPPDAASHYSERLGLLPNLGIFCEPGPPPPPADRAAFGLRPEAVVYWSGQNLPKYHPDHDEVFARIALEVPDSQFVFIAFGHGGEMTERFRGRLDQAFARHGLDVTRHCVILPQLPPGRFLAAAAVCDVVLDSIGWSGGKSTLDLLATDPVLVTLPGRFMRGRHTAAILERMGAPRTIARDVDDYVELAVRLGRERSFRESVRDEIRRGKHHVFCDRSAIVGLEDVLLEAFAPIPRLGLLASPAASGRGSRET